MVLVDLNSLSARDKIHILRRQLNRECLERETNIDALIALFISKQHGILLGPPGTGKTYLIELLCQALGGNFFSLLASATTKPEDVFGPVSIKELKDNEVYKRNTVGRLPSATIAYMDEIFKADGDILNTLLKVINERVYHNPDPQKVPLRSMVASSNEVPSESNTGAFVDRFVYKSWVNYIQDKDNWMTLAKRKINGHKCQVTVELESWDIEQAEQEFLAVSIEPMLELLFGIKEKLKSKGFEISDRKWFQMFDFFRAYAWVQNKTSVDLSVIEDLLPDCIWSNPDDITVITKIILDEIKEVKNKPRMIKKELQSCMSDWDATADSNKDHRLMVAIEIGDRLEQAATSIDDLEKLGIYAQKEIDKLRTEAVKAISKLRDDCAALNSSDKKREESIKLLNEQMDLIQSEYTTATATNAMSSIPDDEKIVACSVAATRITEIAKKIKLLPYIENEVEECLVKIRKMIAVIKSTIQAYAEV
jgi:MoxR-like ATPase